MSSCEAPRWHAGQRFTCGWRRLVLQQQRVNVSGRQHAIAVGPDGTVHLVFNSWEFLWYSRNDGGGWSPIEVIALGMLGSIGVDSAGLCHVVYQLPDSTGVPDLYYVHGGLGSWSTPELLADDGWSGTIAVDESSRVHVAYGQSGLIRYRVHLGGSWSAPDSVAPGAEPILTDDERIGLEVEAAHQPGRRP